ncbi:MAG TPA: hypothetical protein VMW69_10875 [Spirochaetia bacterium]|nr:hypothetical protein [Spirochaetia bacterium]
MATEDSRLFLHLYDDEMQEKSRMDSRVTVYIAALTVAGGVLGFLFQNEWPVATDPLRIASLVSSSLSVIVFVFAGVYVVRAYVGYTHRRLPLPNEILKFRTELLTYHERTHSSETAALQDFENYLSRKLADATARNSRNNITRSTYYHRASVAIVVGLVLAAISGVLLAINTVFK